MSNYLDESGLEILLETLGNRHKLVVQQINGVSDEVSALNSDIIYTKSQITQTEEEITSQVENKVKDLNDKILINQSILGQTAGEIRMEVDQKYEDLNEKNANLHSELVQTAASIRSQVSENYYEQDATNREIYSEIEQTAEQIRSEVANYNASLDGKIESTKSSIQQASDHITQYVNRLVEGEDQKIQENTSLIHQTADSIISEVNSKVTEVNDTIAETNSKIIQTADEIRNEVASTIREVDGRLEENKTLIGQGLDRIQLQVSNTTYEQNQKIEENSSKIEQTAGQILAKVESQKTNLEGQIDSAKSELSVEIGKIKSKVESIKPSESGEDVQYTELSQEVDRIDAKVVANDELLAGLGLNADGIQLVGKELSYKATSDGEKVLSCTEDGLTIKGNIIATSLTLTDDSKDTLNTAIADSDKIAELEAVIASKGTSDYDDSDVEEYLKGLGILTEDGQVNFPELSEYLTSSDVNADAIVAWLGQYDNGNKPDLTTYINKASIITDALAANNAFLGTVYAGNIQVGADDNSKIFVDGEDGNITLGPKVSIAWNSSWDSNVSKAAGTYDDTDIWDAVNSKTSYSDADIEAYLKDKGVLKQDGSVSSPDLSDYMKSADFDGNLTAKFLNDDGKILSTYIDENSIVTGYLASNKITAGQINTDNLSVNKINGEDVTKIDWKELNDNGKLVGKKTITTDEESGETIEVANDLIIEGNLHAKSLTLDEGLTIGSEHISGLDNAISTAINNDTTLGPIIQGAIDEALEGYDGGDAYTALQGRVAATEAGLQAVYTKTEVDTINEGVVAQASAAAVTASADAITAAVSQATVAYDAKLGDYVPLVNYNSYVEQTATTIESKVSESTYNSDKDDFETRIATVEQTAAGLTSTVEAFDDNYASKTEVQQTASSISAVVNGLSSAGITIDVENETGSIELFADQLAISTANKDKLITIDSDSGNITFNENVVLTWDNLSGAPKSDLENAVTDAQSAKSEAESAKTSAENSASAAESSVQAAKDHADRANGYKSAMDTALAGLDARVVTAAENYLKNGPETKTAIGSNFVYTGTVAANQIIVGGDNGDESDDSTIKTLITDGKILTEYINADEIIATNIEATQGTIGGIKIEDSRIYAEQTVTTENGEGDSQTESQVIFSLDKNGKLIANDANISGNINATSGIIGNWNITPDNLQKRIFDDANLQVTDASLTTHGIVFHNYIYDNTENGSSQYAILKEAVFDTTPGANTNNVISCNSNGFQINYTPQNTTNTKICFEAKTNGEGQLANGNISWDANGNLKLGKYQSGQDGLNPLYSYYTTIEADGVLKTDNIQANGGTIGGIAISTDGISATNNTFKLTSQGKLTASNIEAKGGKIGGLFISEGYVKQSIDPNGNITYAYVNSPTLTSGSNYDTLLNSLTNATSKTKLKDVGFYNPSITQIRYKNIIYTKSRYQNNYEHVFSHGDSSRRLEAIGYYILSLNLGFGDLSDAMSFIFAALDSGEATVAGKTLSVIFGNKINEYFLMLDDKVLILIEHAQEQDPYEVMQFDSVSGLNYINWNEHEVEFAAISNFSISNDAIRMTGNGVETTITPTSGNLSNAVTWSDDTVWLNGWKVGISSSGTLVLNNGHKQITFTGTVTDV